MKRISSPINSAALILVAFLWLGCKNQSKLPTSMDNSFSPPGTVKVADNFYCDQTEISNLDWREYVYWLKSNKGDTSEVYLASLPDTTVWDALPEFGESMYVNRFAHPAYNNYPVVGISRDQVYKYTNWRTERVLEMLLVKNGVVSSEELASKDLIPIIQNKPEVMQKLMPVYRVPGFIDYVGMKNASFEKYKNEFTEDLGSPHGLKSCSVNCSSIHELKSNAQEYVDKGIIGDVPEKYKTVQNKKENAGINAWTSFRNVCTWVPVEAYLKERN